MVEKVVRTYNALHSIKATAKQLNITEGVVRKCLVTADAFESPMYDRISTLRDEGKTPNEIAVEIGCSASTVNTYIPYVRGTYKIASSTLNAQRIRKCRERKRNQV